MVYECLICEYKTTVNSNYHKHLKTQKHLKKEAESIQKEAESILNDLNNRENKESKNKFKCIWCRRFFSRNDNLERHLKICKHINNSSEDIDNTSETYNNKALKCIYCNNNYSCKSSLNRHIKFCFIRWEKMQKIKETNNKEVSKLKLENKKLKINHKIETIKILQSSDQKLLFEKDLRIAEQAKTIEIVKNSKNITINNTSNKTINYLNTHFGNMIAMEQFLEAVEHTHQLTLQERQDLLNAYLTVALRSLLEISLTL